MKKVIRMCFFTAVLLAPAAIFAQGSGSSQPEPRPRGNEGIRDESNFVIPTSFTGTIVGLKEGILTIKNQKGKELRVALVNKTVYKIGKKKIDASELEDKLFAEGSSIKISYLPFEDKQKRVDNVAVEVRFAEEKDKQKPVLGDG